MNFKYSLLIIVGMMFLSLGTSKITPKSGVASYYHNSLHGRKTANGEIYDMSKLTCAHKTLPFGTILKVYNGEDTVQVVVNDRGPFIKGRDIDLSLAAAKKLKMIKQGVIKVKYEILGNRSEQNS